MFKGVFTALITPFKNGKFDKESYIKIIEEQIAAGVKGFVPTGTTGESPTLTHDEHNEVIKACVDICAGRAQVIAGTGSNSTDEAVQTTKFAEEAGADAALIVTPYYNKPSQEGIYQHFKKIHDETNIPIILYNIPGRCIVNIELDTMKRLAELPRIVGVKDATADLALPVLVRDQIGKDFVQLSGEDATALEFNIAGGVGCISVASNIVPKLCADMQNYFFAEEYEKAKEIQDKLVHLNQVLFCETNPAPVKYAAELVGLCSGSLRLPLVEISDESKAKIKLALEELELI